MWACAVVCLVIAQAVASLLLPKSYRLTAITDCIIFVLMVFVIAQAFLQQQLVGKDRTLAELNQRVAELNRMLGTERENSANTLIY